MKKLFFILVVALITTGQANACLIFCKYRAPIKTYELEHHEARCHSTTCEIKAHNSVDESSNSNNNKKGIYPCIYRWHWNSLPYYDYHYLVGSSRNHIGTGYGLGVRTCLPGQ